MDVSGFLDGYYSYNANGPSTDANGKPTTCTTSMTKPTSSTSAGETHAESRSRIRWARASISIYGRDQPYD